MRTPLIALLFLFASQLFSQTHGVGPDWGPEVALPLADTSASQRGVLFNNMAVSSSGRIFISTEEINAVTGNFLGHYLTWSDDDGLNWAAPIPIAGMEKVIGASGPKLAMDPDDNLYVLFEAKAPSGLFLTKYSSADLSIPIDTVRVGYKVVHNSWATHLTCDAQGTLHAVWHEGDPNSGKTSEVFYSHSTDGGLSWSPQVMLSDDDGRSSAFPRVQMEAANGDLVAIAWRDSISPTFRWNVLMAVSEDGGQTWSAPFPVVASPDMNSDPDVVIDDQNRIHLFFHRYPVGNMFDGALVGYGWSDDAGNTWQPANWMQLSEPGIRSHLVEGNRYDPVNDILWSVWKDERDVSSGGGPDIVVSYSTDRGNTWSEPEFATDWGSQAIGFKAGALLPNGGLALNYEVAGADGKLRVYFRKRNLSLTPVYEEENQLNIALWPQPANASIFLKNSGEDTVMMVITDMLGRQVGEVIAAPGLNEIDVSGLPGGQYLLYSIDNALPYIEKLIITR